MTDKRVLEQDDDDDDDDDLNLHTANRQFCYLSSCTKTHLITGGKVLIFTEPLWLVCVLKTKKISTVFCLHGGAPFLFAHQH